MTGIPTIASYPLPQGDRLPRNTADWQLDPQRAVLLVHDMQRYFLGFFPEDLRSQLVSNVSQLREWAAAAAMPVAYTAQPGGMSQEDRGLLAAFWGSGMRTEQADREIPPPLTPRPDDWVFTKWRYSAFFRTALLERMRESGRDQLVICGVYANIGIQTTAVEAYSHDIQPFLVGDAVADFNEEDHLATLTYVARRCGMVLTAKEVLG